MSNKNKIKKLRKKYISPSFSLSYDEPLYIVKGQGQFLYDNKGRKYLDAINNIQHVGHSHPKVIEAATTQLKKFGGNISKTAKFIGMERSALHRKLRLLGVKDLN